MELSKHQFSTRKRSLQGEPMVWLTAAGLALGVILTVGLLALVGSKGLATFWPKALVELVLTHDGISEKTAGYLIQARERRESDGTLHEEIQLFRGNRELYGERFVFLDQSTIVSMERPEDLIVFERREGGDAMGRIKQFVGPDGEITQGDDASLMDRVSLAMNRAERLRKTLKQVEVIEIGANSRELAKVQQEIRLDRGGATAAARVAELQQEFASFDQQRGEIKKELEKGKLILISAEGREFGVPVNELVHLFAPNRAGVFGKLAEALRRGWEFLSAAPREANTEGGVFPALFGTVVMTMTMSLFVTPFGVIAAIYLREYAGQGILVKLVRISVNNLAGVPSIVFGVFGLAFFVYFLGGVIDQSFFSEKLPTPTFKSGGILWASLTLALLTVPVMIVATEEALAAVPRGVREAALASGASKWQTIQRVVLPASLPGILTGVILAMARGAGEVAPLMIVGVVKSAPALPIDFTTPFLHAERQFMHLGFHIYDLGFQSPDSEAAKPMVFATTLVLILIVLIMNLGAIVLRNRLRRNQIASSF